MTIDPLVVTVLEKLSQHVTTTLKFNMARGGLRPRFEVCPQAEIGFLTSAQVVYEGSR